MSLGFQIDLHPIGANRQARFREVSNEPVLSLRRKKCACGKTVTAKQLKQFGCCDKCVRAA